MSSLTASLFLAFVLLLRLGGVPGPLFSSPVLCQVWKLDGFLLDSFQELFSRALSADPDLAFVLEVSLRDCSFVKWSDLCSHLEVLRQRWQRFCRSGKATPLLWSCILVLFGRALPHCHARRLIFPGFLAER